MARKAVMPKEPCYWAVERATGWEVVEGTWDSHRGRTVAVFSAGGQGMIDALEYMGFKNGQLLQRGQFKPMFPVVQIQKETPHG